MKEERLLSILNSILNKNGKSEIERLDNTLSIRKDLGFDSFDLAELTVRIEDEFGVDIFENGLVDCLVEIIDIVNKSEKP